MKLLKFAFGGGLTFGINLGFTYFLNYYLNLPIKVSYFISLFIIVVLNFILSFKYIFKSGYSHFILLKYLFGVITFSLFNYVLVFLCNFLFGDKYIYYFIFFITLFIFFIKFYIYNKFIFKK